METPNLNDPSCTDEKIAMWLPTLIKAHVKQLVQTSNKLAKRMSNNVKSAYHHQKWARGCDDQSTPSSKIRFALECGIPPWEFPCGFRNLSEANLSPIELTPPLPTPPQERRRSRYRPEPDTKILLHKVCAELVLVLKERFVMQNMAKIEACCQGEDFEKIEKLDWYDFSGCTKKYIM